jgi:hypothetical protein
MRFRSAALLLIAVPAHAERRVALVIGNAAYRNVRPLRQMENRSLLPRREGVDRDKHVAS